MHRLKSAVMGVACALSVSVLALATLAANTARPLDKRGWRQARGRLTAPVRAQAAQAPAAVSQSLTLDHLSLDGNAVRDFLEGRRLFEEETFRGNGRTCLTCHSRETGTVSPKDARARFRADR